MKVVHSELREIDDKNIEKLHMDAATGKLRIKRRDRGIGFEDSDSEEEGERRPRPKKARKDNDNIVALGDYGMLFLRELFS